MRPRFPRTVTIRNPGPPAVDPDTGNRTNTASVDLVTRAYLSQRSVAVLRASDELAARQETTIATYTLIVPGGVALQSDSVVIDESQVAYRVAGEPAERRGLGPVVLFRAAALHRISDLQA